MALAKLYVASVKAFVSFLTTSKFKLEGIQTKPTLFAFELQVNKVSNQQLELNNKSLILRGFQTINHEY